MKAKRTVVTIITNAIAWMISLICLIPLLLIVFNSFKDKLSAAKMDLKLQAFPSLLLRRNFQIVKGKLVI